MGYNKLMVQKDSLFIPPTVFQMPLAKLHLLITANSSTKGEWEMDYPEKTTDEKAERLPYFSARVFTL